ncbi:hypothetical protein [Acrocarpospora catenulata]|uniref:hypothetical protein n=1 Tax=Acrocarpospora catenulata TaxID=2836182 RepID=UPI001BD97021|nr:hypothetical protein [Acrocarpospora catenulata]
MTQTKMDTGQDWTSEGFTQDEYEAMAEWYATTHGEGNLDLCAFLPYMLDLRPDALKRYRHWVEYVPAGRTIPDGITDPAPLVWLHYYTTNAYREGHFYEVIMARGFGATKAEVAQTIVLGWLHGGPRGLNAGSDLSSAYMADWKEEPGTVSGLKWPTGWAPDPDAFRSGIDLDPDTPFTGDDLARLESWHRTVQGAVPGYVRVLAEVNPSALKLWRARYENAAYGPLPKQFIALLQVHQAVMIREPKALRRAVHMARAFGATRPQLGQILGSCQVYQGDLGMGALEEISDLLEGWPA